jgi:hypothetical protein
VNQSTFETANGSKSLEDVVALFQLWLEVGRSLRRALRWALTSRPARMEEPDAALEFERLVVLGPRIAAEQLRADRAKLKGFLARLLALCCPYGDVTAPSCTQATSDALRVTGELSKWVLFLGTKPNSGENPEEYIRRIQEAYGHTSKVCGRIWGKGYVAYRCRTCGMSPCSAICHECFEKGPHRNHNFLMYRSVAGGCCDCGDPGAWKPSGFCCDHKGPTTTFSLPLPDDELLSTFVAIYAVMEHVTLALKDFYQAVSQVTCASRPRPQFEGRSVNSGRLQHSLTLVP